MNNYSKQESEKAMSEMRDFDYKVINNLYQFSLLWSQIGNRAELFNCRSSKRGKKFA